MPVHVCIGIGYRQRAHLCESFRQLGFCEARLYLSCADVDGIYGNAETRHLFPETGGLINLADWVAVVVQIGTCNRALARIELIVRANIWFELLCCAPNVKPHNLRMIRQSP